MSTPINDGGPAYPSFTDKLVVDPKAGTLNCVTYGGMSLRAHFAGQAMLGLLMRTPWWVTRPGEKLPGLAENIKPEEAIQITRELVARTAVGYADRLIAELNRPEGVETTVAFTEAQ